MHLELKIKQNFILFIANENKNKNALPFIQIPIVNELPFTQAPI